MLKINWSRFVAQNIPLWLRKPKRLAWLRVLLTPVRWMWVETEVFREQNLYFLNHTGQVIYLEKVLNDRFDALGRNIYITDGSVGDYVYRYAENEPKWIYRTWRAGVNYAGGDKVMDAGTIYEALNANVDERPSTSISGDWVEADEPWLVFQRSETDQLPDFIVYVPFFVNFNEEEMKALIDRYRIAGRTYLIEIV